MSESVWIAIIVAAASLITQLIISWVQPCVRRYFDRKENRRVEICKCFSELFGLLAVQPPASAISPLPQKENQSMEKSEVDKWFSRYSAVYWELRVYISKENQDLDLSLQKLSNIIADLYALRGKYILLSSLSYPPEDDLSEIVENITQKLSEQDIILEEFAILSTKYAQNL